MRVKNDNNWLSLATKMFYDNNATKNFYDNDTNQDELWQWWRNADGNDSNLAHNLHHIFNCQLIKLPNLWMKHHFLANLNTLNAQFSLKAATKNAEKQNNITFLETRLSCANTSIWLTLSLSV